jgi:hypothetical protein
MESQNLPYEIPVLSGMTDRHQLRWISIFDPQESVVVRFPLRGLV